MHKRTSFGLASLTLLLLFDGTATAQEDPGDTPAAESSPEPTPEDGPVIAVGARLASGTGVVRIYVDRDQNNTFETRIDEFVPYTNDIQGGVRVALGDFDGDGNDELVTATGGNTPIKVFDMASDGRHGAQLMSFTGFPQGAQVATGDVNGDGRFELVTGSDRGTPKVQVRADSLGLGLPQTVVDTFNAFPQARGVRVALGNTNGASAGEELVTSQGPGTVGRVRVWDDTDNDNAFSDHPFVDSFLPFDAAFNGGTSIAVAAPTEMGTTSVDQILVAPELGRKRLRRWADADNDGDFSDDGVVEQFFPYGSTHGAGVRMATGDLDRSGFFQELVTVPARPAGARPLRVINDNGTDPNVFSAGTQLDSRVAFNNVGQFVAVGQQLDDSYAADGLPLLIADAPATTTVTLQVPASAGIIRDLDVFLGIQHTFNGDLVVTVTHPSGTALVLFSNVGGSDDGFIVTMSDEAAVDIGTADPPANAAVMGSFNPEGAALLSAFDGLDASGRWTLSIADTAGGDVGTLHAFELQLAV